MKLKLFFTLSLGLVIMTFYSFSGRKLENSFALTTTDTTKSNLSLYGEYIFKREKCNSCHSFNINDNRTKVSLDGLGGKYPKSWHYAHLIDPTSMSINSTMPSFGFLLDKVVEKDSIEKYINIVSRQDWNKLVAEAKTIKYELQEYDIKVKSNSEIIALINFLDNISESEELKKVRLKESEKSAIENKIIDSLWAKSENMIKSIINDKASLIRGQEIYKGNCTPCHGMQGEGIIGPNLTDNFWLHGGSDMSIIKTIVSGVPEKGMMSWRLEFTPVEVGQLVAYIKSIKGTNPRNAKVSQGTEE
ncbi:MAG: cbb3-type cytochrome c oxidase subunit II [Bacteroidota bacterium]|nr:cbb3-type cytochrome c oxidase subunit II [Bacteroidota bacterium]